MLMVPKGGTFCNRQEILKRKGGTYSFMASGKTGPLAGRGGGGSLFVAYYV